MKNPQSMKPGEVLCDRYRLEREIGKGGMGTVWAAYDCITNHTVALKMILPQLKQQQTQELRRRLLREARAIKKLRHPNIVQIYAVGETPQGEPFLVLEYLQGRTLSELLKESWRIEPLLAARIIAEVASGLAVAHGEQVIHRDLKPANIFLRRAPGAPPNAFVPTMLDFGVCKELDVIDDINTETGVVPGSLAYMSPEQILAGEELDRRTDIWSLGIVLYELLTGERPFSGPAVDLYHQILTRPVPAPSRRVRDVPVSLDAVVARCTARLADRYRDAHELARDLFAISGAREMKRTLTPMALTVPIVNPVAHKAPAVAVIDEDEDLQTTAPCHPRMIRDIRRDETRAEHPARAATGTQIMPLNQPIASPAPEWRKMYEALEAHRQSSMQPQRALAEDVSSGQTVMIDRNAAPEPLSDDPTGTTSAAGALSQPNCAAAAPIQLPPSRRAQSFIKKVLFGAASGVFVLVAVLLLWWTIADGDKPWANAAHDALNASPVIHATPANEAPMLEMKVPSTPIDSNVNPLASVARPAQEKPAPTPIFSPKAAQNKISAPANSSGLGHEAMPTPLDPWSKPLKRCTGYGVFKRCK